MARSAAALKGKSAPAGTPRRRSWTVTKATSSEKRTRERFTPPTVRSRGAGGQEVLRGEHLAPGEQLRTVGVQDRTRSSKMLGRKRAVASVVVHLDGRRESHAPLVDLLRGEHYDVLETRLKQVHAEDVVAALETLSEHGAQGWCEARPQSSLAWTALGLLHLSQAQEVRGSDRAETVSSSAWERVRNLNLRALEDLNEARSLDPSSSLPGAVSMQADGMGAYPRDHLFRLYAEAASHEPTSFEANANMSRSLQEKWGGSYALSTAFGRDALTLPAGTSASGYPLADAHLEGWFHKAAFEDDPHADRYFTPEVRDELRRGAEHSVLHAEAPRTWARVTTLNAYAFCAYKAQDKGLLRDVLVALEGQYHPRPWYYLKEPVRSFQEAHAMVAMTGRKK
jgi:hypothetical protein